MPGVLRCDQIDLNQPVVADKLIGALATELVNPSHWCRLEVRGRYHFTTPDRSPPATPGWYVICDEHHRPLYAGRADNLNKRLNTPDGSRDGFANPQRDSDSARNFIKAFRSSGLLSDLAVVFITEPSICATLGLQMPLTRLDRGNVEKALGLFRDRIWSESGLRTDINQARIISAEP